VNRYRREIERHYDVLDKHLQDGCFIMGGLYDADISGRRGLASIGHRAYVPGDGDPLAAFPTACVGSAR